MNWQKNYCLIEWEGVIIHGSARNAEGVSHPGDLSSLRKGGCARSGVFFCRKGVTCGSEFRNYVLIGRPDLA